MDLHAHDRAIDAAFPFCLHDCCMGYRTYRSLGHWFPNLLRKGKPRGEGIGTRYQQKQERTYRTICLGDRLCLMMFILKWRFGNVERIVAEVSLKRMVHCARLIMMRSSTLANGRAGEMKFHTGYYFASHMDWDRTSQSRPAEFRQNPCLEK